MEGFRQRTDLAAEARELAAAGKAEELEGVSFEEIAAEEFKYQKLSIANEAGAAAIGKPVGTYYTAFLSSVLRRESGSFIAAVSALAGLLRELAGEPGGLSLVVGLGNRNITPDAIGPVSAAAVLVTRHLKRHVPEDFAFLSPVAVVTPGVLGTSGIESADYIKWICLRLRPDRVIVVDALAARNPDRLCRTVQMTDTGITPGSGVGNSRSAINKEMLGIPVIAIGVPTVIDIRSLLLDMGEGTLSKKAIDANAMIVTPRNIDSEVSCAGRVVAYAINLALHNGLTVEDIDMLIG
ncbi:MAG: GPR endopeptidase [Oscillospiraceae bacterium]|jgi:spore protease|nr:GPR endopeptidase [Oscillospiraceae bacterium]